MSVNQTTLYSLRLSQSDSDKLEEIAGFYQVSKAHMIRDLIRREAIQYRRRIRGLDRRGGR